MRAQTASSELLAVFAAVRRASSGRSPAPGTALLTSMP